MSERPVPIVALDVATLDEARRVVAVLGADAGFFKVGLQLFAAAGPPVVEWLHSARKRVFLDLKLHDIPNTVRHATVAARDMGVALLTVHGLGGEAMVRAAVESAGRETGILAVTILTSMDLASASVVLGRPLGAMQDEVLRLAAIASAAGAHGVVCGGAECAAVREASGGSSRVLVPGIRLEGDDAGDQRRVSTPLEAARAGASYVVLGRTVTQAADPAAAYRRVVAELA